MTETITVYSVESDAIASELTELEQLNLKVAAIAGWQDIKLWNPDPKSTSKKIFVGTNKKHPELGIFVPDYTSDLNAIYNFVHQELASIGAFFSLQFVADVYYCPDGKPFITRSLHHTVYGETPAIALCKLLLELAPNLSKSEPEVQVIDDDGDIDEPTVIE